MVATMTDIASSHRRVPVRVALALRPGDVLALAVGNKVLIVGMDPTAVSASSHPSAPC
jgi:hypothetical protein